MATKTARPGDPATPARKAKRAAEVVVSRPAAAGLHEMLTSPNAQGWVRLCKILGEALKDPKVKASAGAASFTEVVLNLARDSLSDESGSRAFKELHSIMSIRGGGRPATVDPEEVRRYHARLVKNAEHDAKSQTGTRFGISTRQVSNIVGKAPKR